MGGQADEGVDALMHPVDTGEGPDDLAGVGEVDTDEVGPASRRRDLVEVDHPPAVVDESAVTTPQPSLPPVPPVTATARVMSYLVMLIFVMLILARMILGATYF